MALPGRIPGTNEVTLEVSRTPPLDLGRRLGYLLRYPHGCVEQTVSSAFPQLYLGKLLELSAEQQNRVETNVKAALERLQAFQTSGGGFGYWPGDDDPSDWVTSYAGHFVLEAKARGLPGAAGDAGAVDALPAAAGRGPGCRVGDGPSSIQAYRLFTLALAGAPELGAMNQLREQESLPVTARWRLAATYELAGQPEAADALRATRGGDGRAVPRARRDVRLRRAGPGHDPRGAPDPGDGATRSGPWSRASPGRSRAEAG